MGADISRELDRVDFLLEQTLFYARSAQTHKDYIIRRTSLKSLVNGVIRRNSRAFIENKIAVEPLREDVAVYTDVKWMEFILNQIINNAIKYKRGTDPAIRFSADCRSGSVYLTVSDNGIGIPASDLPRILIRASPGRRAAGTANLRVLGFICVKSSAASSAWGSPPSRRRGRGRR